MKKTTNREEWLKERDKLLGVDEGSGGHGALVNPGIELFK